MLRREAALRHRINRAIGFAQSNFAAQIDLDLLADVACLSKFHFTRVFQGYLHEPPYHFLQRIRLEHAARSLAYLRGKPITEVALDCGFSSSQAFSNAFRKRFSVSPRLFRTGNSWCIRSVPDIGQSAAILEQSAAQAPDQEWAARPVRIETRPDYRLAYVRNIGPYFDGGITVAFAIVEQWAKDKGLWGENSSGIGVCPDNAALTPAGSCLYDAGIAVPADVEEDNIVSIQTIPSGTYAVMSIACRADRMNRVWDWFGSGWLPTSGRTYELRSCYEVYPSWNGKAGRPETGVELCMRLEPHSSPRLKGV